MAHDHFEKVIQQVPEQQRQLLERMMELGLVKSFGHTHGTTGRWAVIYTPRGREFLDLVQAVARTEAAAREARLIALGCLADGEGAFGGFADE